MLPLCIALLSTTTTTPPTEPLLFDTAYTSSALQHPGLQPRARWATGEMVLQGFIGVNFFQTMERTGGSTPDVDGSDEDAAQMPVIGGGAQWKLGGEKIDFGLEAMFAFSWRANATAFAVGGGGAAVAVDIDLYLFEIYGGPVVNVFLSDKTRVYASAGPIVQWGNYAQDNYDAGINDSASGFGTGVYARAGLEFAMADRTMIGLGVRWADSTIDLDNGLGDLDLDGIQAVLTVTQGF